VDAIAAVGLAVLAAALAATATVLVMRGRRREIGAGQSPVFGQSKLERPWDVPTLMRVVEALPGAVLLIDQGHRVRYASAAARAVGLVRIDRMAFPEISAVASAAVDQSKVVDEVLSLLRPPFRTAELDLRVRAIPFADRSTLLLVDDLTEEKRVTAVRRDFIANVSHELKTPVGAILLLAEALVASSDDAEAIQHFASRMHTEAMRLSNLTNDVIDLSRLQGEDPLATAEMVAVDDVVHEAASFVQSAAEAKQIRIITGGRSGLKVLGMPDQLVTAVRNLLSNAISYSPEETKVAVAVRLRDSTVQIAVKDQGIGIAPEEQDRIFERFYRVDDARSRVTGGTGLGLAIVRNVCRNHGGDVDVWSVPGEGSTFTIQLPLHSGETDVPVRRHP
jgi:two-component system sensor histidine kinase SenX3